MGPIHLVFIGSIFLSAFLLFMIQPLVTRMLLPVYGGSPAVWNTALVFFQTLLLGGYLYAHLLSRLRSVRSLFLVHGSVLLLPLLVLPPTVPGWLASGTGTGTWPVASLVGALTAVVAAPLFALSSNASLIQWWWSQSGFRSGDDPYWLYGASNFGSLLALLAYPFLLEPLLGVGQQTVGWSLAYAVFVVLTLVSMIRAASGQGREAAPVGYHGIGRMAGGLESAPRPTLQRRALWVARAAVGSSLLLSVTTQITTDLAPTPLLWVVPLALYLVTFILAFGLTDRLPRRPLAAAVVVTVLASAGLLVGSGSPPFWIMLGVSLATLFCGALLCHRDLAADRPGPGYLTAYYLWISFGGALGGALNSLVAPVLFDSVAEHPLTLMALAALLYLDPEGKLIAYRPSWRVGLVAGLALVWPLAVAIPRDTSQAVPGALLLVGGIVGLATARYVSLVAVTVWTTSVLTLTGITGTARVLAQERSFFGVVSVLDDGRALEMLHGNTLHGRQSKDPALRRIPSPYYHPAGPLGSLVVGAPADARIGIVGLGTGALAAAARPGQRLTFIEIDPLVERMARRYFSYLADSPAQVDVVMGDGRLTLERMRDASLDLLVVDAFSSDFVPVHLLTDEALSLYLRKVTPSGRVALHISNRHADLRRVVRGYSLRHGRPALFSDYSPTIAERDAGASRTLAAVLSPSEAAVTTLASSALWTRFGADVRPVHWTDDHADLLSVLR